MAAGPAPKSYNLTEAGCMPQMNRLMVAMVGIGPPLIAPRTMKLQPDRPVGQNIVTAYGAGYIDVNGLRHTSSLLLLPQSIEVGWGSGFAALGEADFAKLAQLEVDVLLLGTGSRQLFPEPSLLRPLMAARIGFELMDSAAAARTFNILMAEGRQVAALLCIDSA